MLLYSIDRDSVSLQYLWRQCQVTAEGLAADWEYDVLGGNAGAVMVFLKAYHLTGREQYRTWAREAGDHLLCSAAIYEYGMGPPFGWDGTDRLCPWNGGNYAGLGQAGA